MALFILHHYTDFTAAEEAVEEVTEEIVEEIEEVVEEVTEEEVQEIEEEVIEEAVVKYVANCGALSVYKEPTYDSRRAGKILANMEVEVIGDEIQSGNYTFVLVRGTDVTNAPKEIEGYVNVKYLAEERNVRNTTGYSLTYAPALTAPCAAAEKVNLPFLEDGCIIPILSFFKIEYTVGDYAYISAKINGERVEIGYVNNYNELDVVIGTPAEVASNPSRFVDYVASGVRDLDSWNDIR